MHFRMLLSSLLRTMLCYTTTSNGSLMLVLTSCLRILISSHSLSQETVTIYTRLRSLLDGLFVKLTRDTAGFLCTTQRRVQRKFRASLREMESLDSMTILY